MYTLQPYCRFNSRVLHRIGIFRSGLHYLLEASEPLPVWAGTSDEANSSSTTAATGAGTAAAGTSTASASRRPTAIAAFGGVPRPTAAIAATGLDTRDSFMASCTLLLQRVLAMCVIQRDFDRVVGATLSTLADGDATSREVRRAGEDPAFASAEAVLRGAGLLGGEGGGSAGDRVLSGQAMVRLYLLRMLLEIVTLPVAAATKGELSAAEGVYVAGVGSPCARACQSAAEKMNEIEGNEQEEEEADSTTADQGEGVGRGGRTAAESGTQLERWVGGAPPVVDVAADGSGMPSPLYVGRQKMFRSVCSRALRPDWFISLLETCREEVKWNEDANFDGIVWLRDDEVYKIVLVWCASLRRGVAWSISRPSLHARHTSSPSLVLLLLLLLSLLLL